MPLAGLLQILPRPPRLNRDHRLIVEPAGDPENNYLRNLARERETRKQNTITAFVAAEG